MTHDHKDRKSKVYWKKDDIEKIVAHLVATNIRWHHPNIIPLVRQAQTLVLPKEKHRWVQGMASIKMVEKPLNDAWSLFAKQAEREQREREAQERRAEEERERQAARDREAEERRLAEEAERQRQAQEALDAVGLNHPLDKLVDAFAKELAGRFVHYFREHLGTMMGAGATEAINAMLPKSEKITYVRRPKIVVVAIPKNNETRIASEYPDLDIKTLHADYNDTKNAIGQAQAVVGMIDFMSHSQKDICAKHPHFIRVNGGLDSLRHILNGIRNKAKEA